MKFPPIFRYTQNFDNKEDIILRDFLAMERTKLANERTLLSYIRASLYLLLGGIALLQLEGFANIQILGYISLFLTVCLLVIGVIRYRRLSKRLRRFYASIENGDKIQP